MSQYLQDFASNNNERTIEIYNLEIELIKSIINERNNNNIKISNEKYASLLESLEENTDNLKDLFDTMEDNIGTDKLEKSLNELIEKYNSNLDIDLSLETTLIKKVKNEYEIEIKKQGKNYFEKSKIMSEIEIINNILENDIKNKANSEYKAISTTSNTDLSKLTNKNVSISLKLPSDKVKITNNNGSVNVTFSQNGEFVYEMKIRGYTYTYKVAVNNIDKTSPKINVTSTGTSIKSTATDENLKELKVEKDGKTISYKQGEEITTPGIYTITAIDRANNQTSSKEIIYGIFKNTSNKDVKYVPINANKLKTKTLKNGSNFTIKDDSKELADDANVATGNKLIEDGQEYTIIVKGDVTKNGEVGPLDLIALRKNIVGLTKLENEQALAADLDDDGKINVLDLINERKKMVGI